MLTIKEVMERLRVSRSTLNRYIKRGWLPVVKYDRAVRIRASEVERFLQERESGGSQQDPASANN